MMGGGAKKKKETFSDAGTGNFQNEAQKSRGNLRKKKHTGVGKAPKPTEQNPRTEVLPRRKQWVGKNRENTKAPNKKFKLRSQCQGPGGAIRGVNYAEGKVARGKIQRKKKIRKRPAP